MRESACHPKRAFTLLELLVGIVVIAILLALVLPVFQDIGTRAKTAKCGGNLRQIGAMLGNYLAEHGTYPGAITELTPLGTTKQRWFQVLRAYSNEGYTAASMEAPKWMRCPARQPANGVKALGYGYNFEGFGHRPEDDQGTWGQAGKEYMKKYWAVRPSQVEQPGQKIVIGDSLDDNDTSDITTRVIFIYRGIESPYHARRHSGGGNYLFADGHVAWLHVAELGQRVKAAAPHPFHPF